MADFSRDNADIKPPRSCGIEGWVWLKGPHDFEYSQRWMFITDAPPALCYLDGVDSEQQMQEVAAGNGLDARAVLLQAASIVNISNSAISEINVLKNFQTNGNSIDHDMQFTTKQLEADVRCTVTPGLRHAKEYEDRIGTVLIHVISARNVLNVEEGDDGHMMGGYCRLSLDGANLNSNAIATGDRELEWDQTFYMPVHSSESELILTMLNSRKMTDEPIGQATVNLSTATGIDEDTHRSQHFEMDKWYSLSEDPEEPDGLEVHLRIKYASKENEQMIADSYQEDVEAGRVKDRTLTYKMRTLSNEIKYGWIHGIRWASQQCPGGLAELSKGTHSGTPRMPPAPLLPEEAWELRCNPSKIDLPFARLGQLLNKLKHTQCLGVGDSRSWKFYATFQMEMYAHKLRLKDRSTAEDRSPEELGSTLQAFSGLDFHATMERLCLLSYGKLISLDYQRQMDEYEYESRCVAVHMIATCCQVQPQL